MPMARTSIIVNSVGQVGAGALEALERFGRFCVFSAHAISYAPLDLFAVRGWRRLLPQCYAIGSQSVPVLMLTGSFVGMVLIVQGWDQFDAAGMAEHLGAVVNMSVAAELGPVLAGVMLAGRVGGALTAELGTMNVTEQLYALRSMGCNPIHYLATPRFLACLLLTPLLTCYADLMGALGAWAVYALYYGGESEPYWRLTADAIGMWDLCTGLLKALFFGGVIGLVSCFKGFYCRPGAQGVGRACTEAFVTSFIVILVLDFFLNLVVNRLFNILYGFRSLI
ncbi:MAG: ABC transporter permease [Planctomycetota bacterium]|nr:MAG: ABC transporter permease [Planctomycetota bacterium]